MEFCFRVDTLDSTKRPVRLATATPENAERILQKFQPEETANLSFFHSTITVERETGYLMRMFESNTDQLFILEHTTTHVAIGTFGLHEIDMFNRTARMGALVFDSSARHKGYGRLGITLLLQYAFSLVKLNKVYLKVFVSNERGRSIYRRLGFVEEGTLRQEYLLDGVFHDMVLMSILKSEYERLNFE